MELPQSRPFETKGRKPTHDFLSLCSHSNVITTDPKPTPPSSQGSHLKTHDFLQPLECVGANEDISRIDTISTASGKPPLQHVLSGGIGTYTISSSPYFHYNHQRVPKPEMSPPMMFSGSQASGGNESNIVDENSNGFALWDECGVGKKGQKSKGRTTMRADVGTSRGRRSQSLTNNHLSGFSSRSSSQGFGLKSQSFMDMMRSAKGNDKEDFIMKKETSSTSQSHRGSDKDQKLNTPKSKHSATEQRRRSKINDRLQRLRQLIPNSDQKRDKASFLQEVIEYIQFLVEKADQYDTSYQGWNREPTKLFNWRNNQQLVPEGSFSVTPKLEEEKNNIPVSVLATATTASVPVSVQSNNFPSPVIASTETDPSSSSRDQGQTQPVKEEEEDDEEVREGNISISSVYSQGLVKTLRGALENSGVDLTKANISVEIKLAQQLSSSLKEHVKQTRKPKRLKTGQ